MAVTSTETIIMESPVQNQTVKMSYAPMVSMLMEIYARVEHQIIDLLMTV